MKQELPIAVVLLAAGGLIWLAQSQGWFFQQIRDTPATSEPDFVTAWPKSDENFSDSASNLNIAQVGFEEPIETPSARLSEADVSLASIAEDLRKATFKVDFQIELNWQHQEHLLIGNFLHSGQGSERSRTSLLAQTVAGDLTVIKIRDGRFLYTKFTGPNDQRLDFVDLSRVNESRIQSGLVEPGNPMGWTSSGGMLSLLENLSEAFQFGSPEVVQQQDGRRLSVIRGSWNKRLLVELVKQFAPEFSGGEVEWEQIPKQIPHAVTIRFVENQVLGSFPQEIRFSRFRTSGKAQQTIPMAAIRFFDPQPVFAADLESLKLDPEEMETLDTTSQYTDQIRDFKYQRQAQLNLESSVESTSRK